MNQRRWAAPVLGVCVFLSQAKPEQVMYGNVNLTELTIDTPLRIIGLGHLDNVKALNDVSVVGALKVQHSTFMGDIYIIGSSSTLESTQVAGNIKVTNYLSRPKLKLHNTSVEGKVIFKGVARGCVEMDANSQVLQGIENGEVCK